MGTRDCGHITASSSPAVGEAGKTGNWRIERPVIDLALCTPAKTGRMTCFLCWLYCPDAVITKTIPPVIDLDYCKGCGICEYECPTHAIRMVPE